MAKHTHKGTCQVCGNQQAHRGTVAKHGYTVDWGFFNGVCAGSDALPLQLDTTLAERYVTKHIECAVELEQTAAAVESGTKVFTTLSFQRYDREQYKYVTKNFCKGDWVNAKYKNIKEYNAMSNYHFYSNQPEELKAILLKEWDKTAARELLSVKRTADLHRQESKALEARIKTVFGTELIDVSAKPAAAVYEVGQTFEYKNRVYTLVEPKTVTYKNPRFKDQHGWHCEYKAPRSTGVEFLTIKQLGLRIPK